ncbi:VOC family protein [Niallia nealsonii]|uniref:VOC domain-containing protein n=1 Tax=Niallia nealsonii TaxID=115979 RepID=A0A2N0Z4B6_9BACI|nr:VOC family protein [Niallia nealsonii]PKG24340.1 hypothetical protein CWS01_06900 [Niallia nealsonii]
MKINQIELSINHFEETVAFYKNVFGFIQQTNENNRVSFQVGESALTFLKDEQHDYFYHFAFNIHANLFSEAKAWLSSKVVLAREDGEDEIEFHEFMKAKACYFEDPAGNIVELIARKETSPMFPHKAFSPKDNILSISEIGLGTDEIKEYADKIQHLGIPIRHQKKLYEEKYLNFFGEYEEGAFIILSPLGRKWLFSKKTAIEAPLVIHTNKGIISTVSTCY